MNIRYEKRSRERIAPEELEYEMVEGNRAEWRVFEALRVPQLSIICRM